MAQDEATVRMTGDDREALAMWRRQFAAVDRLDKKLDLLGRQGALSGQKMSNSFAGALLKVGSLVKGVQMGADALRDMADRMREFDKARSNATRNRADTFANFLNVAEITDPAEAARAKETLNKIAPKVGADDPKMIDLAAAALASSGFKKEAVLGGGAEAVMRAFATAGLVTEGFDPSEYSLSLAKVMKSTGQEMTAENLAKNANQVAMLKQKGVLEFEHLPELAAEAGAISEMGHVVPEDIYNFYEELIQKMPHRIAGTAMRTMTSRLATAGGDVARVNGLKMLGLDPKEVDFAPDQPGAKAETYTEVLEKLAAARGKLPENEANIAFEKVFGAEGLRAALELITPGIGERMRAKAQEVNDPAALDRAFKTSVTDNEAAQARAAEARKTIAMDVAGATLPERVGNDLDAVTAERVKRGEISKAQQVTTSKLYEFFLWLQSNPEAAAQDATTFGSFFTGNWGDSAGNKQQVRRAIENAGGDVSKLGMTPGLEKMSDEELQGLIDEAKEVGYFRPGSMSTSRHRPIHTGPADRRRVEKIGARAFEANEELLRRQQERQQPASNQGAAADLTPMLQLLEQINTGIQQLATADRQPQKLILESGGRQTPARKAVQSFNSGGSVG